MAGNLKIPNQWPRITLVAAQSVLSGTDLASAFSAAELYNGSLPPNDMKKDFSFERMSGLHQSLRSTLGRSRMAEFATRAGQMLMDDNLAKFKPVANAARIAMMVGTQEARIKLALEFFSKYYNSVSDQQIELSEDRDNWVWTVTRCAMCAGAMTSDPACELNVGMVQALMNWVVPDRRFDIRESECKASGGRNCVILISKM